MRLGDLRLNPPREPREAGMCSGCGEAILADEERLVFESGRMIHAHPDCKLRFVDRMLGCG
ncbi:hypothetical protein [Anaeroselena agilis]|uniref:Uncharacterized protein n=1 Tax=Anaeroselena agilis TaxID=3063788 RepID=A0ABU3NX73_9FIRM|nr:hypothetical protein [Selenomonadales bacterium 4137-cl]